MKQIVFMILVTAFGVGGAFLHPIYPVLVYYAFAVLRPQGVWAWALPESVRWSLIVGVAAAFGTALAMREALSRARWNIIVTFMLVFAWLLLISCLTALDAGVAQHWGIEYFKVILMAVLATLAIHQFKHIIWLYWAMVLPLAFLAWEINVTYFTTGRLYLFWGGFEALDNNGLGLMLAMGLPLTLALVWISRSWTARIAMTLVSLALLHAVMMSFSRGAMLSAIAGGVWLALHHKPRWQCAGMSVIVVAAVFTFAGPEISDRFGSIWEYRNDGSAQSRFDSWAAAWKITADHPWTGVGIRNANLISKRYGADIQGRTIHSQYLQISADNGLPALAVYVTMCGLALWRFVAVRRRYANLAHHRTCRTIWALTLAMETSFVIFLFGGIFLSLEVFELPWLLLVLAGALPRIVDPDRNHAPYAAKIDRRSMSTPVQLQPAWSQPR